MVLLVDDFQDLCEVLQRMLENNGLTVVCAHDTYQAEAVLRNEKPAVIVLDDSMPGRSGLEWLRELKADPVRASIPVIMFSAYADASRVKEAKTIGANDWVVKGKLDWNDLIGNITNLQRLADSAEPPVNRGN